MVVAPSGNSPTMLSPCAGATHHNARSAFIPGAAALGNMGRGAVSTWTWCVIKASESRRATSAASRALVQFSLVLLQDHAFIMLAQKWTGQVPGSCIYNAGPRMDWGIWVVGTVEMGIFYIQLHTTYHPSFNHMI